MATLPPDPWKMLGVDKSADKAEIRTAYKKLVLQCHPDKVQDATLKAQKQDEFQKVQQAYELLTNDAERAKYDDQVKLQALRKQAAAYKANTMANTSAARSPPTSGHNYAAFNLRTGEPRYNKSASGPPPPPPPTSARMHSYSSSHSRSHEDMPTRPFFFDHDVHRPRSSRRTTSYDDMAYEKPLGGRDEDRRDDRRRRRDDDRDTRARDRSRDRSKERERERKDKKSLRDKEAAKERERERERKAKVEDKARRAAASAYVEEYDERERHGYARSDKLRSSGSRKDDAMPAPPASLPRDKSSSRRTTDKERIESPARRHAEINAYVEQAINYIERSRGPGVGPFKLSHTEPAVSYKSVPLRSVPPQPPTAPTPPPPSPAVHDEAMRASSRAAGRRASYDMPLPLSSKEKASPTAKKTASKDYAGAHIVDAGSPKDRAMPAFKRGESAPSTLPEPSPPPPRRSRTQPDAASLRPPQFARAHTWAVPVVEEEEDDDALDAADHRRHTRRSYDDEYDNVPPMPTDGRHQRRMSRRPRSPDAYRPSSMAAAASAAPPAPASASAPPKKAGSMRYKVEGLKTTRMEDAAAAAAEATAAAHYSTSPGRYTADVKKSGGSGGGSGSGSYAGYVPFHVKEGKSYGPHDVQYALYPSASGTYATAYSVRDDYTDKVFA